MSQARHVIKQLRFEIQMDSEAGARQMQDKISTLAKQQVIPLLERYLDQYGAADTHYRIDKLELDLEHIRPEQLETALVAQLSEQLKKQLPEALKKARTQKLMPIAKPPANSAPTTHNFSLAPGSSSFADDDDWDDDEQNDEKDLFTRVEQERQSYRQASPTRLLEHFLSKGYLPWWSDHKEPRLLQQAFEDFLQAEPDSIRRYIQNWIKKPAALTRLIALDDKLLQQLLKVAADYPDAATESWLQQIPKLQQALSRTPRALRHAVWSGLIRGAFDPGLPSSAEGNAQATLDVMADALRLPLSEWLDALTGQKPDLHIPVREAKPLPLKSLHITGQPHKEKPESKPEKSKPESPPNEAIFIENAGLVLIWPYLDRFFDRMGYLEEKQFKDESLRQQALTALHYLACADKEEPEEHQLVLNKVLCGMPLNEPYQPDAILDETALTLCDELLEAVTGHIPIIQQSSINAFRGSFLLRQGKLSQRDGHWLLNIERKTHDVLLDNVPWAYSWFKLPWMSLAMRVEW